MSSSFDLGLDGKVVLVTGGSRGIGRAVAAAFLNAGSTVRIVARDAERLIEAAAALGPRCSWAASDVTDEAAAASVVEGCVAELGAVDVLVNNAGMGVPFGRLVDLEGRRAAKAALVNQWSPVVWAAAAWRAWMADHGGAVVSLASLGGVVVWPDSAYYGATKAALIHLTRHLALELGPGVRVNAVAPGAVETDMTRGVPGPLDSAADVADVVVYLASARASLISGQTIVAALPGTGPSR